ncbi:(2Fe-2S)-binding protein [Marinobacter sp. SS21]|uniref:(2Fe-2S)-binding protein n=1 Tax=Marinobacter sp. SS21 TaxID=2979460 RepID=UPI00232F0336|nr:(2Fe-2S)-binding protein [Marinobacter sp. SS21]MDC0661667.1 (2Fe-2S)-binding protein [Marinobacter sp. SS21]
MLSSLLEPVLPDDPSARGHCLKALAVTVPRLEGDAGRAQGWLPLSRLLAEHSLVQPWLQADLDAGSLPSRRVALSQLYKQICLDLLAPVWVAALARGREFAVAPSQLWLRRDAGADRYGVAFVAGDPSASPLDESRLLADVGVLVAALERLFRQRLQLGAASFWSTTALALAQPWIRLRGELDSAILAPAAMAVLEQLDPRLCRYLQWAPVSQAGTAMDFVLRRRGCCFKYQLPGESFCGTCGIG